MAKKKKATKKKGANKKAGAKRSPAKKTTKKVATKKPRTKKAKSEPVEETTNVVQPQAKGIRTEQILSVNTLSKDHLKNVGKLLRRK